MNRAQGAGVAAGEAVGAMHVAQPGLRWSLTLIALLAVGPLVTWPLRGVRAGDGGADISLLLSASPAISVVWGLVGLAAAGAWGWVTRLLTDPLTGMRAAGLVGLWVAWMTGRTDEVIRLAGGAAPVALALEGVLVCVVATAVTMPMVLEIARGGDSAARPGGTRGMAREVGLLLKPASLVGVGVACVASLLIAGAIAISPWRGQALMAGVFGSLLGATAAWLAMGRVGGERSGLAIWAGIALASVVGPLSMLVMGGEDLVSSATLRELPRVAFLQPLDWACGLLLGADRGLSWARSMEKPGSGSGK